MFWRRAAVLNKHMSPESSSTPPKTSRTLQKATPKEPSPGTVLISSATASALLITWAIASPSPIHSSVSMDHSHHHAEVASGNAHGAMSEMGAMPMYFYSTWHTTLWFQSWETKSVSAYVMSLLGLVALGIAHEAIACYRSCYLTGNPDGVLQEPLVGVESTRAKLRAANGKSKLWAAILYALNITTGYLLMLAVMTFNTGYFFAVIGGMGIGYYLLFDHTNCKTALARSEACHVRVESQN